MSTYALQKGKALCVMQPHLFSLKLIKIVLILLNYFCIHTEIWLCLPDVSHVFEDKDISLLDPSPNF